MSDTRRQLEAFLSTAGNAAEPPQRARGPRPDQGGGTSEPPVL